MAPRCAVLAWAALLRTGRCDSLSLPAAEPSCPTTHSTGSAAVRVAPGLVLLQERFSSSVGALERAQGCAPFSKWPHVDNGITCAGCTALVSTAPHNRCDSYCESFGHVCVAAAEEVDESCAVKYKAACNTVFSRTSDMLCTCRSHEAPPVPSCAPFSNWPHIDNGITCVSCTALVKTAPHNRCDSYCQSFGHVCVAAAEEVGDSCAVKREAACDTVFSRTSDMLCTCRSREAPPVRTPPRLPPVCGSTRGCEHCPSNEKPLHAGCFVVKEGKLLAHRITYGGRKFDLPGGQSNWKEPASCTAHRETYEETGYEVTPVELLAGGLHGGGFNLYRCKLLRDAPTKGPDHEVSGVWWLSIEEVRDMVLRGQWRFPEASRYAEWMR